MIVGGGGLFRCDLLRAERKKARQPVGLPGPGLVLFGVKWGPLRGPDVEGV